MRVIIASSSICLLASAILSKGEGRDQGPRTGVMLIWNDPLSSPDLSMVAAFLVSVIMIPISAHGLNLATIATGLPLPVAIAIWLGLLLAPLSVGLESLFDSPEYRRLREYQERTTLWDMIAFRHIPDLRSLDRSDA